MEWIEPQLKDICNTDVVYYSDKYKDTCKKITRLLFIDTFPTFNKGKCYTIKNNEWENEKIPDEYKKFGNEYIFDNIYGDISCKKEGNNIICTTNKEENDILRNKIFFIYDDEKYNYLRGVMHFTEYYSGIVFHILYKDFAVFEKELRNFIIYKGFGYIDFIDFFLYKIITDNPKLYLKKIIDILKYYSSEKAVEVFNELKTRHNNQDEYLNLINEIEQENIRFSVENEIDNNAGLQILFLLDEINFCNSKHEINDKMLKSTLGFGKSTLSLNNLSKYNNDVGNLRNTIMHSKGDDGFETRSDFNSFLYFLYSVNKFKEMFFVLKSKIDEIKNQDKQIYNEYLLESINKMNDDEIRKYFHRR